ELTPLEEASLQNQKLKAAYEARMARLDPSQAMQKTSLTLSLQRQMMENLVIAKAREKTGPVSGRALGRRGVRARRVRRGLTLPPQLQRKMEERRLRLQEAANRLFSLTLLAFEGLNTAASKDRCLACIEEPFFSPLWPLLLAVYRSVHRLREAALSRSMELYGNAPPAAVGVPTKLLPRDPEATAAGAYPYCAAAQELGLLVLESCPQKKLECIVRALRVICACAEDYHRAREAAPQPGIAAIGADDLLPILSFVALRSGLPQLVSECAALEEFIHERYLIGEEGYCLTSLQSALSYVELLPRRALGK
ncbi:VPS9 domain-containing protein 1, partial [Eschrichtius robustus]|nr:VPS9 domain-containing protein 1 [Eschrichtius robustus]